MRICDSLSKNVEKVGLCVFNLSDKNVYIHLFLEHFQLVQFNYNGNCLMDYLNKIISF